MGKVIWTDEAMRWLNDIFEFILTDSVEAAVGTVEGIYERAQILAEFPEVGHR